MVLVRAALVLLAGSGSVTTVMAGTAQTITFPAIPRKMVTDAPFALQATASSGLPVSYSVVSPAGVATLSSGTVTLQGVPGTVTVKATQPGNATFDAAADVYRSFVVTKGSFVKIAYGPSASHGLGIKADGTLWGWGSNASGQVGNGGGAIVSAPAQIGTDTGWTEVAVGSSFSVGICGGKLWTWGLNTSSQLGQGDTTARTTPTQVGSSTAWTRVATGTSFVVAVQSDGTLWAWGANSSGQLGLGDSTTRDVPTRVGALTTWSSVAAGSLHTLAVQTNGTLWACGSNSNSQLGDGSGTSKNTPVQVGTATNWAKVNCGGTSSYAITTDGTLWSWGDNGSGQLGLGDITARSTPTQVGTLSTWSAVSGGAINAVGVQTSGSLWSWGGSSNVGALGQGDNFSLSVPTQVGTGSDWLAASGGSTFFLALKSDGSLWSAGSHGDGRLGYPLGGFRSFASGGMLAVAQSSSATYWVKSDGTLWGVGRANYWGDSSAAYRALPQQTGTVSTWKDVRSGTNLVMGLRTDGTLWTAGSGLLGQIGDGGTTARPTFVQVPGTTWSRIAAGSAHNLAIKSDGTLWAWGSNTSGQLGDGSGTQKNSPVQIGSATNWAYVACGESSSFAIKTNGTLWAWGANSSGQLGDGTSALKTTPVQVGGATNWSKIGSGLNHTHGIQTDGTLWGWGAGTFGKLGDGAATQRNSPVKIGTATNWVAVQAFSQHSLALRSDGTLWGAGGNYVGQFGNDTTTNSPTFVQTGGIGLYSMLTTGSGLCSVVATSDGTLWGAGVNAEAQHSSKVRVWSLLESIHPAIGTQTISFPSLVVPAYNTPVSLAATASSGLPVTYHISGPASLNASGQLVVTGPGEVKVAASQAGELGSWHNAAAVQAVVVVPPTMGGGFAGNISAHAATLGASANAGGGAATVTYEHDSDITDSVYAFSRLASPSALSAGFAETAVYAALTGLEAGTLYHYRASVTNAAGVASFTGSFTTTATAFSQWAASQGLVGSAAFSTADVDGDGLTNLLEWGAGSSPTAAGAFSPQTSVAGGNIEFTYTRSVAAVTGGAVFSVEWNDALGTSGWVSTGVSETILSNNGTLQQVKATLPAGSAGRRFVRLKVTAP